MQLNISGLNWSFTYVHKFHIYVHGVQALERQRSAGVWGAPKIKELVIRFKIFKKMHIIETSKPKQGMVKN